MKPLTLAIVSLFMTGSAEAQISCTQAGKSVVCMGPNRSMTTQTDLGNGMGIIMDQNGRMESYAIMPAPRSSTPGLQPLAPLPQLPQLPSLPSLVPQPLAPPPVAEPFSSGPLFLGPP
jgi:hypothetical protein